MAGVTLKPFETGNGVPAKQKQSKAKAIIRVGK
jgi:hypothetical protein